MADCSRVHFFRWNAIMRIYSCKTSHQTIQRIEISPVIVSASRVKPFKSNVRGICIATYAPLWWRSSSHFRIFTTGSGVFAWYFNIAKWYTVSYLHEEPTRFRTLHDWKPKGKIRRGFTALFFFLLNSDESRMVEAPGKPKNFESGV